jgi:hypothetical protein
MEHHITVTFGADRKYDFRLRDEDTAGITWAQAQQWIDEEYVKTEFEAIRPAGVAPLADKILCIAIARGPETFAQDAGWAAQFARCAGRATGRVNVTVSVANRMVDF